MQIWYKRETWNIVSLFLFVLLLGWLMLAKQIALLVFSYFLIYYMLSLLPLFQALIRAVFYSFMSYSLMSFEQRGERYRNKKSDNKASQHRLFFFKSLTFRAKVVSLWSREVCFFSGSPCWKRTNNFLRYLKPITNHNLNVKISC